MATATLIKSDLDNLTGNAALYKVEPATGYHTLENDKELKTEYIVVSAVDVVFSGPETYIFPADSEGNVLSWGELEGSYRGGLVHETALANAGYTVV